MYSLTTNPEFAKSNIGFFTIKNVLDNKEIDFLNKYIDSVKLEKGTIGEERCEEINLKTRNSSLFFIYPESEDEQIRNIFKKITSKIIDVNKNVFEFNLTDIEPLQYTRYSVGDFYKLHMDVGSDIYIGNTCRKLSFSIQLTDPSEYSGGNLLGYTHETPMEACKDKGSMTFFPSFITHEVKPVTRGVRNSLVGWCWGPKFK